MVEPLPRPQVLPQSNIWNPSPQVPLSSVTAASVSFWSAPVHPVANNSRSLSRTRGTQPSPLSSSSGGSSSMQEYAPQESSRGRSRSTSTSVVYDLLLKTTTGQRGSTRTASQPPLQAGLHASAAITGNRPAAAGRARVASMQSDEASSGSSPSRASSTLADLHDPPGALPQSLPQSLPSVWNDHALPQRSPTLDRHFANLRSPQVQQQQQSQHQQQMPPSPAAGSINGIGRGGISLPGSSWNPTRGRQPSAPSPPGFARGRELSPASTGGIAYSNMSPFTRDGSRQLAFGTSPVGTSQIPRPREHSVSLIGGGRREPLSGSGPLWTGSVEEGDEEEGHPQTKSGATSRRHSLAVLPPRVAQVSHGFTTPLGSAPLSRREPSSSASAVGFGHRSLGFSDDELSADLNSLQLSVDAQGPPQPSSYGSSPQQRTNLSNFGTSPTFNAAAAARAYFSTDAQQQTPFSPFSNQPQMPARSMPPYASASSFTSQQAIELMGPPVYFGAQTHPQPELVDLGKGLPMHHIPTGSMLYFVEFKAGRTDLFYVPDQAYAFHKGDLVIVEADRGKDLGRVVHDGIVREDVLTFQKAQAEKALSQISGKTQLDDMESSVPLHAQTLARMVKEIQCVRPDLLIHHDVDVMLSPKQIYGLASPADVGLLSTKQSDEAKALMIVRAKIEARQLPMVLSDAEWQIDRRKLTIFYVASRRIDFRDLVRELFKVFKTRIWFSPVERALEVTPPPPGIFGYG